MELARTVRAHPNRRLLHETVENIYEGRAATICNEGIESQITEILRDEGVDDGAAIIRALAK